jgi:hypothetical protein
MEEQRTSLLDGWVVEPAPDGSTRIEAPAAWRLARTWPVLRGLVFGTLVGVSLGVYLSRVGYPLETKVIVQAAFLLVGWLCVAFYRAALREEWWARAGSLEVRRTLLGATWSRGYTDARLVVRTYKEGLRPAWMVKVVGKLAASSPAPREGGQSGRAAPSAGPVTDTLVSVAASIHGPHARQTARALAELLAQRTGWPVEEH